MRLSNYILYGTTAIIFCLAVGYAVYIAFPGDRRPDSVNAELKSSLEKISEENKNLRADFTQAVAKKEAAEEALGKATEVSKKRNDEIAKLEEQLASLSAANQSPTDNLNQQVIADLLGLLKCPITELANRTKFSLDQNVSLQQLLTNANQKLSESQKKIDTLSSQVSRLQLANNAVTQTKENTPLIPPLMMEGSENAAGGEIEKRNMFADKVASKIAGQSPAPIQENIQTRDVNAKSVETATRRTPSENEIALSKERERLLSVVAELQLELKNRENLLLAQTSLIEDLKKQSSRTETTFRQNLDGTILNTSPTIRNVSPKPFREIGTFKTINR